MGHYHTSWSDTPVWLRCVCLGSCGFLCGFMGWTVYHENKEMKKTISTEIGVEIKSLDSIQLSKDDRVDNNKKYYVTLSGKLKETVNNSNQWKVTYKLSEIDYSYLLNKCDGNESTIAYLKEYVFPYCDPIDYTKNATNSKAKVSDYRQNWANDYIM